MAAAGDRVKVRVAERGRGFNNEVKRYEGIEDVWLEY